MLRRSIWCVTLAVGAVWSGWLGHAAQGPASTEPWTFVVSGDARNCGNIVMPAIAETARANKAAFYWHLGDLRRMFGQDEDIMNRVEYLAAPMSNDQYREMAWQDFIDNSIAPFGSMPFFIGIGNHELFPPAKTREDFLGTFTKWLDTPVLKAQREKDYLVDFRTKTYFHWIDRGIAFYYLDNASIDMFDDAQLSWFERVLPRDIADPSITAIVAGMHKPLPDGYNTQHSMNESVRSTETGRRVYASLLKAQDAGKRVYVLASHQHFYMADAYDVPYWKERGGVLPGWVIGTAGAIRYALPKPSPKEAKTNVYGSLVATVKRGGEIKFDFKDIDEGDTPPAVTARYGKELVRWCFASNTLAR